MLKDSDSAIGLKSDATGLAPMLEDSDHCYGISITAIGLGAIGFGPMLKDSDLNVKELQQCYRDQSYGLVSCIEGLVSSLRPRIFISQCRVLVKGTVTTCIEVSDLTRSK